MTKTQKKLALAIHTANSWSADTGDGINLLSLGTTRKIHNEAHRQGCIRDINRNVLWNRAYIPKGPDDVNQPSRDIPALKALQKLVQTATIGKEWLTFDENNRFNEQLYQSGQLT